MKATFAAGCFWGVEAAFRKLKGVRSTQVGYSGGTGANPTYEQVCTGKTGHAESVLVEYEPKEISYGKLLDTFWTVHNPTTLNRQGPDVGTQYRSMIFYHTPDQEKEAKASQASLQKSKDYEGQTIVTEIVPVAEFNRAEEYHQQYLEKRGISHC